MEQKYDLKTFPVLNSMHDQRIESMELQEKMFVLHYDKLYHNKNNDFHSCDVIFTGIKEADICAEVRKKDGFNFRGVKYYDNEFLKFVVDNHYSIETIRYYHSYETVLIQAILVDKSKKYCEDCVIRISANEVLYRWK